MDQIGRYKIIAELGRGGFGRVFKAFDPKMDRTVAVKTLVAEDKELLKLFEKEAAATARLRHNNIVTVFDYGEHAGVPYLVMEFLDGRDLHKIISSGPDFSLLQKMAIMAQVADGLHHAHLNRIVHRDVKPANIMVLHDGTAKIMDFGIARLTTSRSTRVSQSSNLLLGTVSYMAPEQLQGGDVDHRCDIFGYATMYYELLTGVQPFRSPDLANTIYRITTVEPEPIRSLAPFCPEALQRIIARAMQKVPDLRYSSMEDLQFDIAPLRRQLARDHALALVTNAAEAFASGDVATAQRLTREALELDSENSDARQLREKLRQHERVNAIRQRSQASMSAARADIENGEHTRAVHTLESALRLDPDNADLMAALQSARATVARMQRAARLLEQARLDLADHNLTSAWEHILECLQHSPGDAEAAAVMASIRKEIDHRDRQRRLNEAIASIDALIRTEAFDEALVELESLKERYPDSDRVKELLASAYYGKCEHDRRQQVAHDLAGARAAMADRRWSDAVDQLERIIRQSPADVEVTNLLAAARSELTAHRKAAETERLLAESRAHLAAGDFNRAVNLLQGGLRAWPEEPALLRMLGTVNEAKQRYERECAVRDVTGRVRQMIAQRNFTDARLEISAAARAWASPDLEALRRELDVEAERSERLQQIAAIRDSACRLMESGAFADAVEQLHAVVARYPGEPGITELLVTAQGKLQEQQRRRDIEHILECVNNLLRTEQFDAALSELVTALNRFPDESSLLRMLRETEAARLAFGRDQAKVLCRAGRWEEALQTVRTLRSEYGYERSLLELEREIRGDWENHRRAQAREAETRAAAEEAAGSATALFEADSFEAAIADAQRGFDIAPADTRRSEIMTRGGQAHVQSDTSRRIAIAIESASRLRQQGRLHESELALLAVLEQFPTAENLVEELASVRAEMQGVAETAAPHAENVPRALAAADAADPCRPTEAVDASSPHKPNGSHSILPALPTHAGTRRQFRKLAILATSAVVLTVVAVTTVYYKRTSSFARLDTQTRQAATPSVPGSVGSTDAPRRASRETEDMTRTRVPAVERDAKRPGPVVPERQRPPQTNAPKRRTEPVRTAQATGSGEAPSSGVSPMPAPPQPQRPPDTAAAPLCLGEGRYSGALEGQIRWSGIVDGTQELVLGPGKRSAGFTGPYPNVPVPLTVKVLSGPVNVLNQQNASNGCSGLRLRVSGSGEVMFTLKWSVQE